ncbi:S-adenosyl-L-methionine-dependent methyltransferase [Dacryopinax primogenitus]|uniref:DNA (cytosine-5-)-methyltransferase n=1 Tax=Dacryopinax primogenitus (strain DJM 731) TaxID=1858805 RepID=M5GG81_DACPD|nr:S-adenosyl-L-methionine-dependent methyltransferase [Dacryopinax primogenitus]EJU05028.1 S-adenosyl-L-methionine-dependent methyltransferase [Dacryopinax primogenitus]
MSSGLKRPYANDESDLDSESGTVFFGRKDGPTRNGKALRVSATNSRASSITAITSPITLKCAQLSTKDEFFTIPEDCLQEQDHLLPEESLPAKTTLPDESLRDDSSATSSVSDWSRENPPAQAHDRSQEKNLYDKESSEDPPNSESLPIRVLTDFILYDENNNNRIVSLEALYEPGTSLRAYGFVSSLPVDPENEEELEIADEDAESETSDENTYELNLSAIFSLQIDPNPTEPMFWLRTSFAWYILDRPDPRCLPVYVPYWKHLYLARLALSKTRTVTRRYKLTYDSIMQEELGGAVSLFSTSFTDEEIRGLDVCSESDFYDLINDVNDEDNEKTRTALELAYTELLLSRVKNPKQRKITKGLPKRTVARHVTRDGRHPELNLMGSRNTKKHVNIEFEVLKHRNPTYATPFVRSLASDLCFRLYGQSIKEEDGEESAINLTCDPETVLDGAFSFSSEPDTSLVWKLSDHRDEEYVNEEAVNSYLSAASGSATGRKGLSLRAGDLVVVRGDPRDEDPVGASKRLVGKGAANDWVYWFAQVIFFYKNPRDRESEAHVRWLAHSSRTQLGEAGHPRELVLRNLCSSINLSTILNKIKVQYIRPWEEEPSGFPYRAIDRDNFFYRYAANHEGDLLCASRFMFPTETEDTDSIHAYGCFTCHLRQSIEEDNIPRMPKPDSGLLLYKGVTYHLFDFVYFGWTDKNHVNKAYRIGQIVKINRQAINPSMTLTLFERYDEVVCAVGEEYRDHKRLVATQRKVSIYAERIRGKCYVMHRDAIRDFASWMLADDRFFVDHAAPISNGNATWSPTALTPLPLSDVRYCHDVDCNIQRISKQNPRPTRKLRALDLYHGAGGLSHGLEKSGAFETCWGVDLSPSAHMTFKKNFPNAIAIFQCANEVLRHAIENAQGADHDSLYPIGGGDVACPPLPNPGDPDIIICGPPCQGYSVLNSYRRTDDIKNTLVANALSYVDYFRPRFFLLENVQPLLNSRGKVLKPGDIDERIIENAVRKFIVRFLTARGYQVRVTVLQAGEFGVAQHRARVFFWAAKRNEALPEFPLPTHTWARTTPSRRDALGGAPLPCVTVKDVIGDLPEWHWINPKKLMPRPVVPKPAGPHFDAVTYDRKTRTCGYAGFVPYATLPATAYQKELRGNRKGVRYHSTLTYVGESVERVCNVPRPKGDKCLDAGRDYRELDGRFSVWHLTCPHSRAARGGYGEGKYARVYPDRPARTVLTRNEPTGKQGRVLHYNQNRVLSAQENARLQGFADTFTFISGTDDLRDIMRLIGNAVPIPLGYHLGRQLASAALAKEAECAAELAIKGERSPSPDL